MSPLIRNSRIKLAQGQIFWREIGQGIPLIFLHGWGEDSSQWLTIIQHFGSNYHCFTPDLLGFGDSERPNIHYSITLEVECLTAYVEALNLKEIYLIGHSLGGWIAASYALKYPDQVKGLVLVSPDGLEAQCEAQFNLIMKWLVSPFPLLIWSLKGIIYLAKSLGFKEKIQPLLDDREKLLNSPISCQLLWQRPTPEIRSELLSQQLPELHIPTLVLQGKQDFSFRINRSKNFVDLIPSAQFNLVADGKYNLPVTLPENVIQEIEYFLQNLVTSE